MRNQSPSKGLYIINLVQVTIKYAFIFFFLCLGAATGANNPKLCVLVGYMLVRRIINYNYNRKRERERDRKEKEREWLKNQRGLEIITKKT